MTLGLNSSDAFPTQTLNLTGKVFSIFRFMPKTIKRSTYHKVRIIFLPFLLLNVITLIAYGIVRLIMDIYLEIPAPKSQYLELWIPAGVCAIILMVFLRKRYRLLKGWKQNDHFGIFIIALLAMAIPLGISQNYISKISYGLKELSTAADIDTKQRERYYRLERYVPLKDQKYTFIHTYYSGRHSQNFNVNVYIVAPLLKSPINEHNAPLVFFAEKFHDSYRGSISNAEKDQSVDDHYRFALAEYDRISRKKADYFENPAPSDEREGFIHAIEDHMTHDAAEPPIFLTPNFEPFEQRLSGKVAWLAGTFLAGNIAFLIAILASSFEPRKLKAYLAEKPIKSEDDLDIFRNFFIPKAPHTATTILVYLNLLVFIVGLMMGHDFVNPLGKELLDFGGMRIQEVNKGEYWRILTAMFIHSGIFHLGMNMLVLGFVGSLVEGILKPFRFVIVYLLAGLSGALVSLYWNDASVIVGASGAIFGIIGIVLAFSAMKVFPRGTNPMFLKIFLPYIGINILFGLVSPADNAGHLGGLAGGFILGLLLVLIYGKENLIEPED